MATWLGIRLEEIFRHTPDDVDYFAIEVAEIHQGAARRPRDVQARYTNLVCRVADCFGRVALWPFEKIEKRTVKGQHLFMPPEGAQVLCDTCGDQWTEAEYNGQRDLKRVRRPVRHVQATRQRQPRPTCGLGQTRRLPTLA